MYQYFYNAPEYLNLFFHDFEVWNLKFYVIRITTEKHYEENNQQNALI
jgi:hypothetical protein